MNLTTVGCFSAFTISSRIFEITGAGVPLGKNMAYQLSDAKPGRNFPIGGRSGKAEDFFSVVTAMGFTLPERMCGAADGAVAKRKSVSPDISPTSAGPPPL